MSQLGDSRSDMMSSSEWLPAPPVQSVREVNQPEASFAARRYPSRASAEANGAQHSRNKMVSALTRKSTGTRRAGGLAGGAVIRLSGRMTKIVASTVAFGLASRALGIHRFGDFVIVFAYIQLFSTVANFGIDRILIRDLAQPELTSGAHRELVHVSITSKLLLATGMSVLAVGAGVALGFPGHIITSILLFSPFIVLTAFGSNGIFGDVLQAHGDNGAISVAIIVSAVVTVASTGVTVLLHSGTDGFLLAYTLSSLADMIVCALASQRRVQFGLSWRGSMIRYLLVESFPLAIGTAFVLVYGRIDTILLEKLTNPQQVALYGVAYKFYDVLSTVSATIMIVLFPALVRAYSASHEDGKRLYTQIFTLMAALALPLTFAVIVFRSVLLQLLVGSTYLAAQAAVPWLMIAIVLIFPSSVASYMIVVLRQQRLNLPMAVVASVLNIGLNLLLIPRFGYVAAAWITVATEAFVIIFNLTAVALTGHMLPSLGSMLRLALACLPFGLAFLPGSLSYAGSIIGILLFTCLLVILGIIRPAQLRALVMTRTPVTSSDEETGSREISEVLPALDYVASSDQPSMELSAITPASMPDPIYEQSPWADASSKTTYSPSGGEPPRRSGSRPALVFLVMSGLVAAISVLSIVFLPFGVEIAALLVYAALLILTAIRPQRALFIFVLLLPLHNFLMALLFNATSDATFVKVMQPWKEVVLGVALLRAVLPVLLEFRHTRRIRIVALDVLVLLFVMVCAVSVAFPSPIVPLTGRLFGFRQLVLPLAVYVLGRLAPPTRREVRWLIGSFAVLALANGVAAIGERTVWGSGLFTAVNYGAYDARFFNFSSYLPNNMGTTFFTGTPNWLPRAGSLAMNPLDLATLLSVSIPFILIASPLLQKRAGRPIRLMRDVALIVAGAGLVLAFSRMNLLLLPVECILLVVLAGIRHVWRAFVLLGTGCAIGISLYFQTTAYVLDGQDGSERITRALQGLLNTGNFTLLDLLAPIITLSGVVIAVVAFGTAIWALARRRRATFTRSIVVGISGTVVVAACLLFAPLAVANASGMFADLVPQNDTAVVDGGQAATDSQPPAPATPSRQVISSAVSIHNTSTQGHLASYEHMPALILHHPLGYGIGSAGFVGSRFNTGLGAESAYLPVGVELGLPGLLLYLGILLAALVALWSATRSRLDPVYRLLFIAATAAWIFILGDGVVTEVTLNFFVLYVLFWLTGSAVTLTRLSRVVPRMDSHSYDAVRPLRVAMDAQCLQTAQTGVRTYVTALLDQFARSGMPHEVTPLYGPRRLPSTRRLFRIANQVIYMIWLHGWLPVRLALSGYDVLFSPEYMTPVWTPTARVITYHQSSVLTRPQDYNRLWRLMFRWITLPSIRRSDAVIVVSQYTGQEGIEWAKLSPNRVYVVPLGGPSVMARVNDQVAAQVLERYGVKSQEYFLHVGVLERRKNLPRLIEAFALWRQHGGPAEFKLVLVGQPGPRPDLNDLPAIQAAIQRYGLSEHVVLTGHLSASERDVFYTHANTVVIPSVLEGFGLPVLEAFAAQVPVVCSTTTSLPEVAGNAALLFNPTDATDIAGCLMRMGNQALRASLVQAGNERLHHFTWEQTAQGTSDVFEQAVVRAYAPLNTGILSEG